jgi:hypothetical protein
MAIYYPELFCEKGTILELTKNISVENTEFKIGDKFYVLDIINYSFTVCALDFPDVVFSILNSEVQKYFNVFLSFNESEHERHLDLKKTFFKKDYSINESKFNTGDVLYYEIDCEDGVEFYNLFDTNRKILRMNSKEANDFLTFPTS